MSTVGTAPLLLGLVHLDVRYVKRIDIQTFHLQKYWQKVDVVIKKANTKARLPQKKKKKQYPELIIPQRCSQHSSTSLE